MSRFADPTITDKLPLGPCDCPGKPHAEGDWVEMRTEVGAEELKRLQDGDSIDMLESLAVSWNLLDSDGTKATLDREHIDLLFADNFGPVNDWTKTHVRMERLPNARAVRSPNSGRANGSRIPRALKAG